MYQVLARKWRPRSFAAMAGQEHVLRALMNALTQGRLHHAYLFTGTRGVGKTTLARLLAKCLNCEQGISAQPCGECESCQAIDQGRFIDLIEVDAASRTKVEDTRELLDNVQYAPSRGRFKIYLIDEVHMLSGHSFNALLKTLEEPPEHVKFLLATTDPQRLPITVLSRCLQFNLKSLSSERIAQHLQHILGEENIPYETAALQQLARAAAGSVRDALSLLDQAIAFGNGAVNSHDVSLMLGSISPHHINTLLQALVAQNAQALIDTSQQLAEHNTNFATALEELLSALHQIAVLQALSTPARANDGLQQSDSELTALAAQIDPEDVQLYYQIALIGRKDLPLAPTPRSGFEMVLLRMLSFCPLAMPTATVETAVGQTQQAKPPTPRALPSTSAVAPITSSPATATRVSAAMPPSPAQGPVAATVPQQPPTPPKPVAATDNWATLLPELGLSGLTLTLANYCALVSLGQEQAHLALDPSQAALLNDRQQAKIAAALSQHLGRTITVKITVGGPAVSASPIAQQHAQREALKQNAQKTLEQDNFVQELLKKFDATLQTDSLKPVESAL